MTNNFLKGCLMAVLAIGLYAPSAMAQDASEKEIEKYRKMIGDPMANPGYLNVDRGEDLWQAKARHQECLAGNL